MVDYQQLAFDWISHQHWLTGLVVFSAGLLYAFAGFRMFQFLLVVTCALLGWAGGYAAGYFASADPAISSVIGTVGLGALAVALPRFSVIVACGGSWLILGHYLVFQLGAPELAAHVGAIVAGGLGALFAHLCYRSMTVALTTAQGVAMLLVGWVGLAEHVAPSVGSTFRAWADGTTLLVPVMLSMLGVMSYSVQAAARRGHMLTGTI